MSVRFQLLLAALLLRSAVSGCCLRCARLAGGGAARRRSAVREWRRRQEESKRDTRRMSYGRGLLALAFHHRASRGHRPSQGLAVCGGSQGCVARACCNCRSDRVKPLSRCLPVIVRSPNGSASAASLASPVRASSSPAPPRSIPRTTVAAERGGNSGAARESTMGERQRNTAPPSFVATHNGSIPAPRLAHTRSEATAQMRSGQIQNRALTRDMASDRELAFESQQRAACKRKGGQ